MERAQEIIGCRQCTQEREKGIDAEEIKEIEDVVEVEEKAEVQAICSTYYLFA